MITITITDEKLQESFNSSINDLLAGKDKYDNPIKKLINDLFGYYSTSEVSKELKGKITDMARIAIKDPSFQRQVADALAVAVLYKPTTMFYFFGFKWSGIRYDLLRLSSCKKTCRLGFIQYKLRSFMSFIVAYLPISNIKLMVRTAPSTKDYQLW